VVPGNGAKVIDILKRLVKNTPLQGPALPGARSGRFATHATRPASSACCLKASSRDCRPGNLHQVLAYSSAPTGLAWLGLALGGLHELRAHITSPVAGDR